MSAEPIYDRRPSWRVIRIIHRELCRQSKEAGVKNVGMLSDMGQVTISGSVDIAMIAHITEQALRREFGL